MIGRGTLAHGRTPSSLWHLPTLVARSKPSSLTPQIGPALGAFRYGARAVALRQFDDVTAHRVFQPFIALAGDELPVGFQLDEPNPVQSHQLRPVGAEIVDRQGDILESHLASDLGQKIEVVRLSHTRCRQVDRQIDRALPF